MHTDSTKQRVTLTIGNDLICEAKRLAEKDMRSLSNYVELLIVRARKNGSVSAVSCPTPNCPNSAVLAEGKGEFKA